MIKTLLISLFAAVICFGSTTSVRIYQQAIAPASMQNKQIGVGVSADPLGFKMWSGKDADGNITSWLAKDKNASVDSINGSSGARFFRMYIDSIISINRILTATADSLRSNAVNSTRFYYGISKGDSTYSKRDTSLLMKADSGNFTKLRAGTITGATNISADTIGAVHVLNLRKHAGAHFSGDGDVYYDSVHRSVEVFTNGTSGTMNRCIWAQSNIVTDSASTAETSLKGVDSILLVDFASIGDSLPDNFFSKSKRLRYGISGTYQTKATSSGTMIIRLKLNNTLIDSVISTLDNNEVEQVWRMDGAVVCATTGVSGTVRTVTSWNHGVSGVQHTDPLVGIAKTVNTTIKQRFNLTFQFSDATTATRANKINSIIFYLEEIR